MRQASSRSPRRRRAAPTARSHKASRRDLAPGLLAIVAPDAPAPELVTISPPPATPAFGDLLASSIVVGPDLLADAAGALPDDPAGSFQPFTAADSGAAAPPVADADVPPAAPHHSDPRPATTQKPGAVAKIAWNGKGIDSLRQLGADPARGSRDWLNDFLNHLGQEQALWDPNAGLRVRPGGTSAHA
jgi:hypothetical protein